MFMKSFKNPIIATIFGRFWGLFFLFLVRQRHRVCRVISRAGQYLWASTHRKGGLRVTWATLLTRAFWWHSECTPENWLGFGLVHYEYQKLLSFLRMRFDLWTSHKGGEYCRLTCSNPLRFLTGPIWLLPPCPIVFVEEMRGFDQHVVRNLLSSDILVELWRHVGVPLDTSVFNEC